MCCGEKDADVETHQSAAGQKGENHDLGKGELHLSYSARGVLDGGWVELRTRILIEICREANSLHEDKHSDHQRRFKAFIYRQTSPPHNQTARCLGSVTLGGEIQIRAAVKRWSGTYTSSRGSALIR